MKTKNKNNKESILRRLKIAEGHLKKVISMIEDNRYCIDILQQSSAVRSALKKTQDLILERHLQTCVKTALKDDQKDKVTSELINIYLQSK